MTPKPCKPSLKDAEVVIIRGRRYKDMMPQNIPNENILFKDTNFFPFLPTPGTIYLWVADAGYPAFFLATMLDFTVLPWRYVRIATRNI